MKYEPIQEKNLIFIQHVFSVEDTEEEQVKKLEELKNMGYRQVLASYKTQGMAPAKFDDTFFQALDIFVSACQKTGICFWLEDYAPFPTGSANGAFKEPENEALNKLFIDEHHFDICGPIDGARIQIDKVLKSVYGKTMHRFAKIDPSCRKQVAVVAYQLTKQKDSAASVVIQDNTAVRLDDKVEDGLLQWDVPEGQWRIFVIYTTSESEGRAGYMNLLSKDSVALEIEKVHVPLYEHLKEELGKTWIGFFYDEPEIGNSGGSAVFDYFMLPGRRTKDPADCDALPWSPEMPSELEERDQNWILKLPFLFYKGTGEDREYRVHYMDAVTKLIRKNYNGQVWAYCHERGIGYIGHVLEDENCHTRLGCGPGHYFREQYYQDEAGVDVIAGQIMPGKDGAATWYGAENADGEFYHYMLAKLASSEAHINPLKGGRSFAECFAMYGTCGFKDRKFLIDHLLVNGINRMLVMERTADETLPQYIKDLSCYTEKMCRLLRSTAPVMKTAILYHAEAEWYEGGKAQKAQSCAAELARNQISYDIVPSDIFESGELYHTETEHGLVVNGNPYEALIIPGCTYLPDAVKKFVIQCSRTGFPVFFTDCIPEDMKRYAQVVPVKALAGKVREAVTLDMTINAPEQKWIRLLQLKDQDRELCLIHNEAPVSGTDCEVLINTTGSVYIWNVNTGALLKPEQERTEDGWLLVRTHLDQWEMQILCCDSRKQESSQYKSSQYKRSLAHKEAWTLSFPDGTVLKAEPGNIPEPEEHVGKAWYGRLVYSTTFIGEDDLPRAVDLGRVSDCCELYINGRSCGRALGSPYVFPVEGVLRQGPNEVKVVLYTSAVHMRNEKRIFGIPLDALTAAPYTLIEPLGIQGEVRWRW